MAKCVRRSYTKPLDKNRILETPLVANADNKLMKWIGRGAATQMYCTIIFAGKLIYDADATANIYEVRTLFAGFFPTPR
jgi:hypothetical protein